MSNKQAFLTALAKTKKTQTTKAPHVIVEALAGTGKTTTLIEGLKVVRGLKPKIKPSPQQAAVWESMSLSREAQSIHFVAFNKSIASELQTRVPEGCTASTMHSFGFKAVAANFELRGGRNSVNGDRVQEIICELMDTDIRDLRGNHFELLRICSRLVGLCKSNLIGLTENQDGSFDQHFAAISGDELESLASYYELDIPAHLIDDVLDLVPRILNRCCDANADGQIDFDDMVWLPIACNLPMPKVDLLLVDEAQDLNRCQQALALKAGKRLILCGDINQAIYGFAGADCESMNRMKERLASSPEGCVALPLTVTRRCGKAIVAEAQAIVPLFEAHESNGVGSIGRYPFNAGEGQECFFDHVELGDMLLCRVNAPLVSVCFRLIKQGIRAEIQGRDIGDGLVRLIKQMKANDVPTLIQRLDDWNHREQQKELKKRFPQDARLIALQDRYDCITCFTIGADSVEAVINNIRKVFTDDRSAKCVRLSSIHKAKGLEAERVYLLEPGNATVPHPMAKSQWQLAQEWNLRYVAITRAIDQLYYVA